ncbi:MAG: hypothetical protein OQK24_03940 [Magnetovibrio sp.]|nr:hypothetical protein [Magnetovibrio sp.]
MKRKTIIIAATALGLTALATTVTLAHGRGMHMGMGYGPGAMQDSGMMSGYGFGKHFGKGNCQSNQVLETPLTTDDVRAQLEQKLKWRGNDRLKVGDVKEIDDKTIIAEIVTVDDSLVRKIQIDKATGRRSPVN